MRFRVHLIDGEWWVESDVQRWGGFPSQECAAEVAERFESIEHMLAGAVW